VRKGRERAQGLWTFSSPATSQRREDSASGTGPAGAVVAKAVAVTQAGRLIRSAEQHQEERPISLVFGSGSAAFRTVHDDLPFGRAQAPPPYPAALFQEPFKNRKLIRHLRSLIGQSGLVSFDLVAGSSFTVKYSKTA